MDGRGQRVKSVDQSGRGRVQQFIGNTVDLRVARGCGSVPGSIANNFGKWNPAAGAAPGGDDDFWIALQNGVRGDLSTGLADKFSSGRLDQFRDPGLRSDQRLAPFLAEDAFCWQVGSLALNVFDRMLHIDDDLSRTCAGMNDACEERNISIDITKGFGSEPEKAYAGFQDFDHGGFLIRHGGDDEVGLGRPDLVGVGAPGVVDDDAPRGSLRADVDAIARAGDHAIELADRLQDHRRAGLQAYDATGCMEQSHSLILNGR